MRCSLSTRTLLVCCAVLLPVFTSALPADAQVNAGAGLVRTLDVGRNTLTVETRTGFRSLLVPSTATIRDDHGNALTLGDMSSGDAVTYQMVSGAVTSLLVARQFWAIPGE
jgi:hypothetical protein